MFSTSGLRVPTWWGRQMLIAGGWRCGQGIYEYVVELTRYEFAAFIFADVNKKLVKEQQKRNALPFRCRNMGDDKTTVWDKLAGTGLRTAEMDIDLLTFA